MTRNMIALLAMTLLLVAGGSDVLAANTTSIVIPNEAIIQPSFEVLDSTPGHTKLHWAAAELRINQLFDGVVEYDVPGPRSIASDDPMPIHGGFVAMPWGYDGELHILGGTFFRLDENGNLVEDGTMRTAGVTEEDFVTLGQSAIFRDITMAPVNVMPVVEGIDGSIWVASDLEFEVVVGEAMADGPTLDEPRPVSRAFLPVYESMLLNDIDDLGLKIAKTKGSYLVITANTYLGPLTTSGFLSWKAQKGYNVVVDSYDSGAGELAYADLVDMVADAYAELDPPLEFVLLVGDVNRGENDEIPADRIPHPDPEQEENDVTDWPLAFLDGVDYLPEVLIGRYTIGDLQEAVKVTRRTINYEKNATNISLDHQYWTSAALVAANYNEGGGNPLTPVAITEWLREHMLQDWGFDIAYPLFWTHGGDNATAQEIRIAIDSGVSWVTYRGWGNATGWVRPEFGVQDVQDLTNFNVLPVLTSFVCNTGDFGNANVSRCFSEHWITAGTPNEPTGAVAAIAPSDLHTNTRYNNSLIAGFYFGMYEEGIHNISTALLRAKTELYLGFPTERGANDFVEFYYHVYHVLGDPELSVWKTTPREFDIDMLSEIALGQGHVDILVNGAFGPHTYTYVQLIQGENLFAGGYTNEFGMVSLPIVDAVEGDVSVTVTAPNYIPVESTISIVQEPTSVGVLDWSMDAGPDGMVNRGEEVELMVTLTNGGTQSAANVSATLTFADDNVVTILSDEASFGTIAAGSSANNNGDPFVFTLDDFIYDETLLEFELGITSDAGQWTGKIWTLTGREVLRYISYENTGGNDFAPGETATLRFKIQNQGSIDAMDLDVTLSSFDEAITGISGSVNNLDFTMGDDVWVGSFDVTVDSDTWRGRPIPFSMHFSDNGDSFGTRTFTIPLEGASTTDPLGPDAYGYYAYDDTDTAWPENAPTYTWFNLDEDPAADEHWQMLDDINVMIDLPFDVRYYGVLYPAGSPLTISSNGWVSFADESDYTVNFFRNWQIPSVIGPRAMIAPYWDDIGPLVGEDFSNMYYKADMDNGRLIIEWTDSRNRFEENSAHAAFFELVIYRPDAMLTETGDSVIEVHFQEVDNADAGSNFATIGVEKPDRSTGLEYTYAGLYPDAAAPLADGRAIRFTTNAPDDLNLIENPENEGALPGEFTLYPVQPNPFNSTTVISFDLPESGDVQLSIYNLLGQELVRLVDRPMTAGHKEVVWQINDRSISSGMLLIQLSANGQELWGKAMYVK
jgi:Peptidase family C25